MITSLRSIDTSALTLIQQFNRTQPSAMPEHLANSVLGIIHNQPSKDEDGNSRTSAQTKAAGTINSALLDISEEGGDRQSQLNDQLNQGEQALRWLENNTTMSSQDKAEATANARKGIEATAARAAFSRPK